MRSLIRTIRQISANAILSVLAFVTLCSALGAQSVDIDPEQSHIELKSELRYWASLGPFPGPAYAALQAGKFGTSKTTVSLGPAHAPEIWFAATLHNRADGRALDGAQGDDKFVLVFDAPMTVGYRLFLVRASGLIEPLVDFSTFQPFDADEYSVNRIKSPEFTIAPGEQVSLLAHVQVGVAPTFSVDLFRPEALIKASFGWGVSMSAFYAFSLSCLLLGLGFQVAMRSWLGAGYVTMFLMFLALIAHMDGLLFRVLYPAQPSVHFGVLNTLFFGIVFLALWIVAQGMRYHPKLLGRPKGVLGAGVGICAAIAVAGFWMPATWVAIFAYALVIIALGLNVILPEKMLKSESNPNVGIRTLTLLGLIINAGLMAWFTLGGTLEWLSPRGAVKLAFVLMVLTSITFLTGNLIVLRMRHIAAVEARVKALEAETEKGRQLLETERAYIRARETAAARQRQLATASHDIKQPLMSLRTTFDAITFDMDQQVRDRLQEAFLYLENLSKTYVDGTVPAQIDAGDTDGDEEDHTSDEVYDLSVPLGTVEQMFHGEAVSKGLRLKAQSTSLKTTAPPMVLMRILANLVSNAVKYTEEGGVLIGVRRAEPSIWICDTGFGMRPDEIEAFQGAYEKGAASTGHGLGLSVCFELALANELPLRVSSIKGQGTIFEISLAAYTVNA